MNWLVKDVGKAKDEFTAVEHGVIKPAFSMKMTERRHILYSY